ncbi:MAG: multidrug efflux MFS transporter [Actinobacteria bacterium]|nr:MAG: multidrug efflux MFS transporter [Actinomycetota bacterium]
MVGGAIGLAVLTTIATSHAHARIADGASPVLAQTDGYQLAFAVGAVLCILGAVAAAVLLRPAREDEAPGELAEARG